MEFRTDIENLQPSLFQTTLFVTEGIPNNIDISFRSKQVELICQYKVARMFMKEIKTNDWNHWFQSIDAQIENEKNKLIHLACFYETALMYYNIVVDLSWVVCYVSVEFACNQNGKRVDFSGMKSIEDAAKLLREAEKSVINPMADSNPFQYLKTMCPEFSNGIELIISFWDEFKDSLTRSHYNFCKHKGKPTYTEIEELRGPRLMRIYRKSNEAENTIQLSSDIRDVRLQISLMDAIDELWEFDDNKLFPYIKNLFEELERVRDSLHDISKGSE